MTGGKIRRFQCRVLWAHVFRSLPSAAWSGPIHGVARRQSVRCPVDSVLSLSAIRRGGRATLFTMGVGYASSRNSYDFPRIMIHEAGHSIAKLMDEYIRANCPI